MSSIDAGPYIFDNSGELVWAGPAAFGGLSAHSPHVCRWKSANHLCFFQGASHHGFGRGMGLILDSTYRVAATIQVGGSTAAAGDMHEFQLFGDAALASIYQVLPYDISPFGVVDRIGWIVESMFQEIRVADGAVLFEWSSLDHEETSPRAARLLPGATPIVGNGLDPGTPFDYFHLNSVDKNDDGDYLVSSRHLSSVYKISGEDGRILWVLHGQDDVSQKSYESIVRHGFNFSSQHDVRWISCNGSHSVISMLDNASDDSTATAAHSRGMLVTIEHTTQTATLASEVFPSDVSQQMLSGAQGSFQLLPNENTFVGWGKWPFFSEHSPSGETLLWGQFAPNATDTDIMSYRTRKFDWAATPHDTPTMFVYSHNATATSGTVFYVSWNGATDIKAWNFYTASGGDAAGPWRQVGTVNRTGFETRYLWHGFGKWSFAEAVDLDGKAIRRSKVYKTFVPSELLREACDTWGCAAMIPDRSGQGRLRPEDVKWEAVGYNEGAQGVPRYPDRQPPAPLGVAWQIGPQAAALLVVVAYVVLLWLSPRLYARLDGSGPARESQERTSPECLELGPVSPRHSGLGTVSR
ncbi:Arylsulfotransferase [Neofusicoccum parvum]|nr:Arylsulfotransferase [Neofusicoccum parvum]